MPRSASNRSIALFCAATISISAADEPEWIDDEAIRSRFTDALVEFRESGAYPDGTAIVAQLDTVKPPKDFEPPVPDGSPADSLKHARNCTLIVGHLYLCDKCDKWHTHFAGGAILSPNGLAASNDHVLRYARAEVFGAMTFDGEVFPLSCILAASRDDDVAIFQLQGASDLPFATLNTANQVGEEVLVFSHPDAHFFSLSSGRISRYYLTPKKKIPRLQVTADFARGSSGSGIFNSAGELVGLVASTRSVHYDEDAEDKRDLQMVVRSGVPAASILRVLGNN